MKACYRIEVLPSSSWLTFSLFIIISLSILPRSFSQDCTPDSSFTDILFVIDNSGSIDDSEYALFSNIIETSIRRVQSQCPFSQIAVMHYGGAFGAETFVEYNFNRIHDITSVERQYCTTRNQFGNCSEGGGDDLNAAMGDVHDMIQNGTLHKNPLNKLAIVIFTDAFGFDAECGFINCSVIRPYTNIDFLKSQYDAKVTVVGASSQAEASLLGIYASPGGTFDNVALFSQDCGSTFDGCELPRKYVPIEFDSPVNPAADSIASCITCTVEIFQDIMANAGVDQTLCEEEDLTATLTAQILGGTAPITFVWDQGLGEGNNFNVAPEVTTTYSVTITDGTGCTTSDQVTIFVENCVPDCTNGPILSCPLDVVLCPGDPSSVEATGMATALPGGPTCPVPTVSFRDSTEMTDACNQTIYRIWTAAYSEDFTGVEPTSCIQIIEVRDEMSPDLIMPEDMRLGSDADCTVAAFWDEPTVTDDCDIASVTVNISSGSTFNLGTTQVIYTAIDLCGNTTIDSFSITVDQNCCLDGPIISCPPAFSGCPGDTITPDKTGMATASASSLMCGPPEITFSDSIIDFGTCAGQIIVTRTWTATDTENPSLTTSCEQIISLVDTLAPVFMDCPSDVTIDPDDPIHSWEDPNVTDACGFVLTYNIESGSTFQTGDTRVVATATDFCGNVDSCSFIVTVPEEVEIICPETLILNCVDTLLLTDISDPEVNSPCELCEADPDNCVEIQTSIDTIYRDSLMTRYVIRYIATDLCGTDNECISEVIIDNSSYIICPDSVVVLAPPHGFLNVSWERPTFQTCCSICEVKQIPGFLYMGQLGDSHYYCSYARVRWTKAQRISTEFGGNLATINSIQENEFLANRLIERHAYIGLSDAILEGSYRWASGELETYRRWKPGQPDNSGNEDYVEMDAQGYWYDVDGRERREFIMEISGCDHVTQVSGPTSGSIFRVGSTTVTYYAEDGCGNTDECSFDIVVLPYVPEEETLAETRSNIKEEIVVAPNPVSDVLSIISSSSDLTSVEIFDLSGNAILRHLNISQNEIRINVEGYSSGLYLMKVMKSDGELIVRKIVVE